MIPAAGREAEAAGIHACAQRMWGAATRAFRVNTAINHIMFTGRRGRVYDRLVVLSGVRPGDSVLDVGSSSGYLASPAAAC